MKSLKVTRYKSRNHWSFIKAWWQSRTGTVPAKDMLNEQYGFVALNPQNAPIAALFLYPIIGSKIAYLGWPIAAPYSGKEERNQALSALFDTIEQKARSLGYRYIWTTTGTPAVANRLESLGYSKGDTGIDQYVRRLY